MIFKDRKDFLRRRYGQRAMQEYRRAISSQTPAPIHQDQSQDDLDVEAMSLDDITDDVSPTEDRSGEASASDAAHSGPRIGPPLASSSSDHGPGHDDDQGEDDEDEDGESEGSSTWRAFHPDEDLMECPPSPRPVQWPHHIRYETDSDESGSRDDRREPSPPSPPRHLRVPGRRYQSSLRPLSPRRSRSDLSSALVLNRPYWLVPLPSLNRSEEQARIALHLEDFRRLWESERQWQEEQDAAAEPPSPEESSALRSSLLGPVIRTLPAPPRIPRWRRRSPLGRQVLSAVDTLARIRRPTPPPDRPYSPPLSDEDDDEEHDEDDWNYPIADVTMVGEDVTALSSPPLEPQRSHTRPPIMTIAALLEPPNFPFPREAVAPRSHTWLRPYEEQTSGSDDDDDEADAETQNIRATVRTNEENERIRHELFSSSSGSSHSSEDGSDSGSDASNHDRQSSSDEDDHNSSHPGRSRPRDHSSDNSHDKKEEFFEDGHPDDHEGSPSTDNQGDAEDIRSAYDGCNLDSMAPREGRLCAEQLREGPGKCFPSSPRTGQERVKTTVQRGSRRPLQRQARGRTDQIKALGWTPASARSRTIDKLGQSTSSSAPLTPVLKPSGSVSFRAPCYRPPSPDSLGKRPRLHSPPRSSFGRTSVLSAAFLPLFRRLDTSDPLFSSSSGSSDDSTLSSEPDSPITSPERLTDSPQSAQVGELTAALEGVMQPQSLDS